MDKGPTHIIEVWGDFACFSRPEMKVERWSYPCPTPSAARGVFDAIFCKGWDRKTGVSQFYWQVERIELLSEPSYIALRRNEVKDNVNVSAVEKWMVGNVKPEPIWADADKAFTGSDTKGRTQRQTMAIRNPHYRLHAHIVPRPGFENQQQAFNKQFVRRVTHGKCFQQPYLGCREFVAFFRYVDSSENEIQPVDYSQNLGLMLYDVFDLRKVNNCYAKPFISLFKAKIDSGDLSVPPCDSDAILKPDPPERRVS